MVPRTGGGGFPQGGMVFRSGGGGVPRAEKVPRGGGGGFPRVEIVFRSGGNDLLHQASVRGVKDRRVAAVPVGGTSRATRLRRPLASPRSCHVRHARLFAAFIALPLIACQSREVSISPDPA